MHRDISPANVVLPASHRGPSPRGFAVATSFAEIRPEFTHPSEIVGTLGYLAPEQTGRTVRPVDQHADLYGLGATLHEVATGAPPLGTGDPLKLIHDVGATVPHQTPPQTASSQQQTPSYTEPSAAAAIESRRPCLPRGGECHRRSAARRASHAIEVMGIARWAHDRRPTGGSVDELLVSRFAAMTAPAEASRRRGLPAAGRQGRESGRLLGQARASSVSSGRMNLRS